MEATLAVVVLAVDAVGVNRSVRQIRLRRRTVKQIRTRRRHVFGARFLLLRLGDLKLLSVKSSRCDRHRLDVGHRRLWAEGHRAVVVTLRVEPGFAETSLELTADGVELVGNVIKSFRRCC